ncbi:MAG: helix-turn-helix domain-containing protein [Chloroflexota bacterium]
MLCRSGRRNCATGSEGMGRRLSIPLRSLTTEERGELERVCRAGSDRADRVAHAKALRAVADGARLIDAAHRAGRRSRHAVASLVARFNTSGLAALDRRHGGGPAVHYGDTERERILQEFRRAPDREHDGTATWSLSTLQAAVRRAPDGLPQVSTMTILDTLWGAGYTWQESRTWCHTGTVVRQRKAGPVEVTDPDATPKKT